MVKESLELYKLEMIAVSIHTNKMHEVTDKKFNHILKKMEFQRYMSPYDYKSELLQTTHKPYDEVLEIMMNKYNEALRNGLRCSIHIYEIESFSPYESRLLYEHW